jgi:hypothetical protein
MTQASRTAAQGVSDALRSSVVTNRDDDVLHTEPRDRYRRLGDVRGPVAFCVAAIAVLIVAVVLHRVPNGVGAIGFVACIMFVMMLNAVRIVRCVNNADDNN